MATAPPLQPVADGPARRWQSLFADAPAVLFALKTYAAACVAYYGALSVGMEHPSWAVTTAYIVSQPLAGGVVGKAVYRLLGTLLSGAMAILLVPNLINAPELLALALALALALWLGFCVFVSSLDRSPRAYTFLMSGYTVAIIAYPVLDAPQTVFTVAAFRVQEICLGIVSAAFFHGAILPQTVTARLRLRVHQIVADAERWSIAALADAHPEGSASGRRKIALDLEELRQLAASLPFDTARLMPRVATVRALRDQLMQLLPLATTVEDRRLLLARAAPIPEPVVRLLADGSAWLATPYHADTDAAQSEALRARAAALEPALPRPPAWRDLLLLSLLARFGELVEAHHNCRVLAAQVEEPDQIFRRAAVPLVERNRWRSMHLDIAGALRTATGAVLTTLLGCVFWIGSAWDQGANAVLFAGVVAALFGSQDSPRTAIFTFLTGVVIGSLVGLLYAFAILPRATDFAMLMLLLAPAFLIGGVGIATPSTTSRSLGFVIGLITASGLDLRYDSSFAGVVNATLALVLGVLFASVMIGFVATSGAKGSALRIVRSGWRDLAQRSDLRRPADNADWTARMIDRIGLLTPRLAALGEDPGQPLLDALTVMRTGVVVGQLRDLRRDAPAEEPLITPVLRGVGDYFAGLDTAARTPPPATLLAAVDHGMAALDPPDDPAQRRRGLLALVGIRRNLFPAAAPPAIAIAA